MCLSVSHSIFFLSVRAGVNLLKLVATCESKAKEKKVNNIIIEARPDFPPHTHTHILPDTHAIPHLCLFFGGFSCANNIFVINWLWDIFQKALFSILSFIFLFRFESARLSDPSAILLMQIEWAIKRASDAQKTRTPLHGDTCERNLNKFSSFV